MPLHVADKGKQTCSATMRTNIRAGRHPATADGAIAPARLGIRHGSLSCCHASMYYIMSLEDIYNANALFDGFMKSRQGVEWKESVQKYEANLLLNILHTRKDLMTDSYAPRPMTEFRLNERGHTRHIKAQHIADRVVQRSLNDNVLIPKVRPMLIYDNGASLKDKGLDFARRRFEVHLRNAYKKYGCDAYILLMDFTKYYDNVRHKEALEMFAKVLEDDELHFLSKCFEEFAVDVSYMSDEEYVACMNKPFNALAYAEMPKQGHTGKRFMRKSLGIGNQSAQVTGIFYPHAIDNYCKTVKGLRYYGRYMDDTYIIMQDKTELKALYEKIRSMCAELGIFINEKKTHIRKISGWLTWLKINYRLKQSGGLVRKVHSSTFRRERRKLKRFHESYKAGRMSYQHINQCYKSWRGTYTRYDSGAKLRKLDNYFKKLFEEENQNGRKAEEHSGKTAGNHQSSGTSCKQKQRDW